MDLWNFDIVSRILFPTPESSYNAYDFPEELIWVPKNLDPDNSGPEDCVPCLFLQSPSARFIVLYYHSNAEDLGRCYHFCSLLRSQFQVHVLAVEYPGYGICPGGQADEETVTENAFVGFRFVREVLEWPLDGIIILGRSIGCGPALTVASKHNVYGVILICPFSSVQELCKDHIGHLSQLITERFPNKDRAPALQSPLLIVHGKKDTVVPYTHGEKLYRACQTRKRFVCPDDMGHNTNLHSDVTYFVLPVLQFYSLPDYCFDEPRVPCWAFDKQYAMLEPDGGRQPKQGFVCKSFTPPMFRGTGIHPSLMGPTPPMPSSEKEKTFTIPFQPDVNAPLRNLNPGKRPDAEGFCSDSALRPCASALGSEGPSVTRQPATPIALVAEGTSSVPDFPGLTNDDEAAECEVASSPHAPRRDSPQSTPDSPKIGCRDAVEGSKQADQKFVDLLQSLPSRMAQADFEGDILDDCDGHSFEVPGDALNADVHAQPPTTEPAPELTTEPVAEPTRDAPEDRDTVDRSPTGPCRETHTVGPLLGSGQAVGAAPTSSPLPPAAEETRRRLPLQPRQPQQRWVPSTPRVGAPCTDATEVEEKEVAERAQAAVDRYIDAAGLDTLKRIVPEVQILEVQTSSSAAPSIASDARSYPASGGEIGGDGRTNLTDETLTEGQALDASVSPRRCAAIPQMPFSPPLIAGGFAGGIGGGTQPPPECGHDATNAVDDDEPPEPPDDLGYRKVPRSRRIAHDLTANNGLFPAAARKSGYPQGLAQWPLIGQLFAGGSHEPQGDSQAYDVL